MITAALQMFKKTKDDQKKYLRKKLRIRHAFAIFFLILLIWYKPSDKLSQKMNVNGLISMIMRMVMCHSIKGGMNEIINKMGQRNEKRKQAAS